MTRLTPDDAHAILYECGVPGGVDFDTLPSSAVEALLRHADKYKYRKPKNANGSRGRYWHAYVDRVAHQPGEQ